MAKSKTSPESKLENLPCRVHPDTISEIEVIAGRLERPVSFMARKFILRGLAAYRRDGLLDEQAMQVEDLPEELDESVTLTPIAKSSAKARRRN